MKIFGVVCAGPSSRCAAYDLAGQPAAAAAAAFAQADAAAKSAAENITACANVIIIGTINSYLRHVWQEKFMEACSKAGKHLWRPQGLLGRC